MSSFMVGRYTLDSISLADLSPPQTCWLGHGRGRSPMTLPQRKAAGMHDPWRRYHRYSPKCVEGVILRSSRWAWPGGIMLVVERVGPWGSLQGGREGEDDEEEAHSETKRAAPLRGAGGLRAGGHRAGVDEPRRFGGGCERGGSGGDRRPGDPGARCEARQDPAPGHRGARGRTAARQGAGRRAGAKAGPRAWANSSSTGK